MAECEHLLRTSMYFDGELPPGEEREAADHVATCEQCQAVLGDAVGLHAVLSSARPAAVVPIARRRRWPIVAGVLTAVAAAAIAIIVLRPKPAPTPEHVVLVLAPKRSLEARFTGDVTGKHRPYEAPTDRAHEQIDMRALTELEQRGNARDLVGALAASGELVRAAELARKAPADAASLSDLSAIALASGDPEGALDFAYQALDANGELAAARWNLALAARKLKYWRVSRAAFAAVAARAEPGWSSEAKQHLALLDRELTRGADIEKLHGQFQLLVRAGSVAATVTDPTLRGDLEEYQRRSRSILEDQTPIELAEVRRFPSHALGFLYESLASPTPDLIEGFKPVAATLDRVANAPVATSLLTKRVDPFAAITSFGETCKNDIYAVPCVPLAWKLAREQLAAGAVDDAEHTAQAGRELAQREFIAVDYELLAEVHGKAGRSALARADSEEAKLASP